jgi:O-antigen/teichoic acid export membrane protein
MSNKLLGLVRIVILSRLLSPEHFGVVAIAALAISLLETFSQSGLSTALVRKKGSIQLYLDTLWTVSLARATLIFVLLLLAAPAVASFFETPDAKDIIRVFGISVLIAGLRNPAVVYFQRELQFSKQYLYEFSTTFVNLVASVVAALVLRNAWALVIGGIAGAIARWVMSYWLEPYRPRLQIDRDKFLELFQFGKWIYGASILFFLINQGDDVFLGKLYGAAALGLYQMAFMISQLVTTEISQVVTQVTFPAFSKIQVEARRLCEAFIRVFGLISFVVFPITGLIFVLAEEFTLIVLSSKWLAIVPMVKILAWAGLLRALKSSADSLFNAVGRPDIHTKYQLVQLCCLAVLIYPASMVMGVAGICIAVLASQAVSTVYAFTAVSRHLPDIRWPLLRTILVPAGNTALLVIVMSVLRGVLNHSLVVEALLLSMTGLASYAMLTYLCTKFFAYPINSVMSEVLSPLFKPLS